MKFAKDTKLVDFGDKKVESPKNEKEWAPKQTSSQVVVMMLTSWYKGFTGKFWRVAELLYWTAVSKERKWDGKSGA